jgi:hypothetical protein
VQETDASGKVKFCPRVTVTAGKHAPPLEVLNVKEYVTGALVVDVVGSGEPEQGSAE